jgi:hypothetical protein
VTLVNEAAEHIAAADLSGVGIDPNLGPAPRERPTPAAMRPRLMQERTSTQSNRSSWRRPPTSVQSRDSTRTAGTRRTATTLDSAPGSGPLRAVEAAPMLDSSGMPMRGIGRPVR